MLKHTNLIYYVINHKRSAVMQNDLRTNEVICQCTKNTYSVGFSKLPLDKNNCVSNVDGHREHFSCCTFSDCVVGQECGYGTCCLNVDTPLFRCVYIIYIGGQFGYSM